MLFRRLLYGGLFISGVGIGYHKKNVEMTKYASSGFKNGLALSVFYKWYGDKIRTLIDPEKSHRFAIWLLSRSRQTREILGLVDDNLHNDDEVLYCNLFNHHFTNPIGMAAGFDKNAECIDGILDMGFGFVEIGSVTPRPQPGNPKPRVFRLEEDHAIINRYGFNSDGHTNVATRLKKSTHSTHGILGVCSA